MDAVIIMIGGSLIIGSVSLSIMLQCEYTQTMAPISYNTRTIDCPDWKNILTGKEANARHHSICTIPPLINHKVGAQTVEDLLADLAMLLSEGDH